jgi:4-hydroxy-3-polyprenylbenzoate decarboxylase
MAYHDAAPPAHRSMREFLVALEAKGLLRRITKPVDRLWEPATLAKWMHQSLPKEARFGMLFENVTGFDIPLVSGALGASRSTYAAALNVAPEDINDAWVRACRYPMPPREVAAAPCHEVVHTGSAARLALLPIPVWTPGKDAAPYITTIVITRHHDSGAQNMASIARRCATIRA